MIFEVSPASSFLAAIIFDRLDIIVDQVAHKTYYVTDENAFIAWGRFRDVKLMPLFLNAFDADFEDGADDSACRAIDEKLPFEASRALRFIFKFKNDNKPISPYAISSFYICLCYH